jgi:hypothetical protein
MSVDRAEPEGLSHTIWRIESVCDRFEAAWQPRPRPRIEEYWLETDGTQLLRELLVLDVVYLRSNSRTTQTAEIAFFSKPRSPAGSNTRV